MLELVRREQVLGQTGHDDVVELEPLRLVDRHDLHRVLLGGLHRRPLLLLALLDRVHVVEEGAQRQLALHRREGLDLVEERGEVPAAGRGDLGVHTRLDLAEQADPPDDLGQELRDGTPGQVAHGLELGPELLEPLAPLR